MKYNLKNFEPELKKDIEEQLDSITVLATLNGYKVSLLQFDNEIRLSFTKSIIGPIFFNDYYTIDLCIKISNNKIKTITLFEAHSLIFQFVKLARATKFRYKNGKLSKPLTILLEKINSN